MFAIRELVGFPVVRHMKTRNARGMSKPRIDAPGAEAEAVRAFLAERIPDARIVGEGEAADFIMIKPADLQELIEDAVAAAAYARTRHQEFVPAAFVDRLLAGETPVKLWREHRGLSLTALAEKAEIGKGYLSQIESGSRKGTVQTLRKLAAALEGDLDDLAARPAR